MTDFSKRIVELSTSLPLIQAKAELSMLQFKTATHSLDRKKMEEARIACHELIDQLLDIQQEVGEMMNKKNEEILRLLRKNG